MEFEAMPLALAEDEFMEYNDLGVDYTQKPYFGSLVEALLEPYNSSSTIASSCLIEHIKQPFTIAYSGCSAFIAIDMPERFEVRKRQHRLIVLQYFAEHTFAYSSMGSNGL